jgi:potassium efflux system protein
MKGPRRKMIRCTRSIPILIIALVFFGQAAAQENAQNEGLRTSIEQIQTEVDALAETSVAKNVSDAILASNKATLVKLSRTTFEVALEASAQLREFDDQIAGLGPVPEPSSAPEPEAVAAERQRLSAIKGETALAVSDAEKLAIQISNLVEKIVQLRRDKFTEQIFARNPASFGVWQEVKGGMDLELKRLKFAFTNWFRVLDRNIINETIPAVIVSVGFAAFIVFFTRVFLFPLVARPIMDHEVPYLRRVFAALWTALVPSAAVAASMTVCYFSFKDLSLLPLRVDEIFRAALTAVGVLTFVLFLTHAVLAPGKKYWRLLEISDYAAWRLTILIGVMAVIYVGDYLFAEVHSTMSSPVAFIVIASFVSTLLFAAVLSSILLTTLAERPLGDIPKASRGWSPWLYWPMWLAIAIIVSAAVAGYVSFAEFLAGQIVVTGPILVAMYIGILSARTISRSGALGESRLGSYLTQRLEFSEISIDQLGLVFGSFLSVGTVVIGVPFILLQWGFQRDDVQSWVTRVLSGFDVGDVRISFANIALAIIVFIFGIILTRIFKRWLTKNVLTRTRLDPGVKHSIGAGVGYFGIIIATIVALDYSGLDLSNLALIAGALSVGIGFGLQNVVNNFVSGIILLIERPVRVGDWIVVGEKEGYVKKISVRATELETFDRQSIVIPNAVLINTSVGNWMLKDKTGRLIIEVGVSYDTNEEEVRDIFYQLIAADDRIATYPAPYVYFKEFGDNALIFQLRVILKDVSDIIKVGGDMRFSIRKAFREASIAIPLPQRDIHIHKTEPT